jgi:uncharacterized RDD family membrane protein YckC
LGIIFYDALLLLAVLFFATLLILPFNSGIAFSGEQFLYPIYLFSVSFLFYGWFWTHGGQTLGLKAWKARVVSSQYQPITWQQALYRYLSAIISWGCLGLGFWWVLIDRQQHSWHDLVSKTELFMD